MRESTSSWQKKLIQGFSTAAELLSFLKLTTSLGSMHAEAEFKTKVPRGFAARMKSGDASDPLLLQVLATGSELRSVSGYAADPLQERAFNPVPGLIHKYPSRVLLVLNGVCAVNCRYCFRRHFPYEDNNSGREGWKAILNYIGLHSDIHEVILSGGDPLLIKDSVLRDFLEQLSNIAHVNTIRFHTRVPVVLPERIDCEFLDVLQSIPLKKVLVLHSNHPNEIDNSVGEACRKLRAADCVLLNQSVLLARVNDDPIVLAALSEKLFEHQVLPYYLHLLDKVSGAAHFDVSHEDALLIFHRLQELLPGYLVPRLCREDAFAKHKTLIN